MTRLLPEGRAELNRLIQCSPAGIRPAVSLVLTTRGGETHSLSYRTWGAGMS